MAETVTDPRNAKIAFGGKRMPVKSKAQNAAMHAADEGKSTLGIPASVGREFTRDQAPGSVKKLPQRVNRDAKKLRARGLISDKQHDRMTSKASTGC